MSNFKHFVFLAGVVGSAGAAEASLKFCNDTDVTQSVSIGYQEGDIWKSQGWWNIKTGECITAVGGDLKQRYYYYRAEVKAGDFEGGGYAFCTSPRKYEIDGDTDCEARGYDTEDFEEIDTGSNAKDYTFRLTPEDMANRQPARETGTPTPVSDGLRFCNESAVTQSVSIGYESDEGWKSVGWWNVDPDKCAKVLAGPLTKRYYYYRIEIDAADFPGAEGYAFCTSTKAYDILGDTNCAARGYESEDFAEIDIGQGNDAYTFTIAGDGASKPGTGSKGSDDTPAPDPDTGSTTSGLSFCNETNVTQSISIGYEGAEGWTSEGWWNVEPGKCSNVLGGPLQKRYYYYRAEVDAADFAGAEGYSFCTTPEAYTIVGDTECGARGYDTEDFAEIDVGEGTENFTFTLVSEDGATVAPDTGKPSDTGETDVVEDDAPDGLQFCNDTEFTQSISVGYEGADGWSSEGWWNVEPGKCQTPLGAPLDKQYYYYRAEIQGGDFNGEYNFCTTPDAYTIVGDTDCEARGYATEGFAEIKIDNDATTHVFRISAETGGVAPASGPGTGDTVVDDMSEVGSGLKICNDTEQTQSLSIGYQGEDGWTSEGWWNVEPGACTSPALDGVNHRYYYYRAEVDGGPFDGQSYFFCTTPEAYTIVGDSECESRGYDREDFREIDTGSEEGEFTFTLVSGNTGSNTPSDTGKPSTDTPTTGDGDTTGGFEFDRNGDDGATDDTPVVDEPVDDEPVVDEPVVDEPADDTPAVEEPSNDRDRGGKRGGGRGGRRG